jgi:CHASE3 domain sensor protein
LSNDQKKWTMPSSHAAHKGFPYAKSVVAVNQHNRTMETIHDISAQIREEETRVLQRHRADSESWAFTTGSFAAVFFLLNAVVFTLCGIVLKMALTSQAQAERLLHSFPRPHTPAPATR